MKKVMFVGCGMFLCLSTVFGMMPKGMAETGDGCTEASLIDVNWDGRPSSSLGSEVTLNEEFPCLDFDEIQHKKISRGRSKSEEIFVSVLDFDRTQSRGFNVCRSRTRSETTREQNMLESEKQREERFRLINGVDDSYSKITLNGDVSISDSDMIRHFGFNKGRRRSRSEEFLFTIPGSDGKQSHRFNEGRSRTRSETTRKQNVIESKKQREEISRQIENGNISCILKGASQVNRFLGGKFFREFKDSRTYADKIKILTKRIVDYIDNSAKYIRKIGYIGDVDKNTKLSYGKGMVSHIYGAFTIIGTFFRNYLDLREKIVIKGSYGEEYKFMGNKNFGREAMISMDDISQVNEVYRLNLSTICLKLSNGDGENEYILFNSDFVYQGELRGRDITGRGRMFRITGEVQEGEFKKGKYICRK